MNNYTKALNKLNKLYELRSAYIKNRDFDNADKCLDKMTNIEEKYKKANALFKVGDIVCFKKHKIKKRYIVTNVSAMFCTWYSPTCIIIGYDLVTINHKTIGGHWTYGESGLELYKK